jgi:hypothetical protein
MYSETMRKKDKKLDLVLKEVNELGDFVHELILALQGRALRQGDDVLRYAKASKIRTPESLRGLEITWETDQSYSHDKHGREGFSLLRPGHSNAIGLVLGCIRVGKWKICLECSWLSCRIVISRRF